MLTLVLPNFPELVRPWVQRRTFCFHWTKPAAHSKYLFLYPTDTGSSPTPAPKAQGTFLKRKQKDSKNQNTRKSVVSVCLLGMAEKLPMIPQEYGSQKKTMTIAMNIRKQEGNLSKKTTNFRQQETVERGWTSIPRNGPPSWLFNFKQLFLKSYTYK